MDVEEVNDYDTYGAAAAACATSACNHTLPAASAWEATGSKENWATGSNGSDAWATTGGKDSSFTFVPATRRRNPFGKCFGTCVLYLVVVVTTPRGTNR